jgi:ABC-type nitrate/sulfonate/bicarbonate transport system substrate-binding protein
MKEQTKKVKLEIGIRLASVLFGIVIAGMLIIFGCSNNPSKIEPVAEKQVSLRLKWLIYSSFAQHLVAAEKGIYARHGLKVDIRPGGPGIDAIKSVSLGEDDIGLASYAQILLARQQGVPVVAIAEEYIDSGVVFMSLKDSGITKPQDFAGKKVGLIPGSDTGTVYEAVMAKERIDRSKLTEITVGSDMAPLFNRSLDIWTVGFISNQPIVAESKGFPVNIIDPKDYGIRVGGNVVFTTEKNLKEKRAELKAFVLSMIEAIEFSKQMPNEEVVDIVLKYNPKLERNSELKIWQATKDHLLSKNPDQTGLMPEATWRETAEVFNKFGTLKQIPDLQSCYTNDLVNEILAERKTK